LAELKQQAEAAQAAIAAKKKNADADKTGRGGALKLDPSWHCVRRNGGTWCQNSDGTWTPVNK
jgi:hypothetical protein